MKTGNKQLSGSNETRRQKQPHSVWLGFKIVVGLVITLGFQRSSTLLAHAADPSPTIRVRAINFTETTPDTIRKAEKEAGRIFREAGLNVVWLDYPLRESAANPEDPCQQPLGPGNVFVRLLVGETRKGIPDSVFGFAILPALASVYYGTAVDLARDYSAETDVPTILGCVMVHEIGHLLLGSNSHSPTGIMQAHWGRKQLRGLVKGDLEFTGEQSRQIRAEWQARMKLEAASIHTTGSKG
jgi:hypothetical protein